jgi:hypothetical protein
VVHRGVPLPKDQKDVAAKNLCFHRVVTNRNEWSSGGKKKKADPAKARYIRTLRVVTDGKSTYRALTKAQMRKLYKDKGKDDHFTLRGGVQIPVVDRSVRAFQKEEEARKRKRKDTAAAKPKAAPKGEKDPKADKVAKKAKLEAALAALDADSE